MNPLWTDIARRAGIEPDQAQLNALSRYLDLLLDANERMNLTRITERSEAELHHVADALTLLPFLPKGPFTLADVGSGGGVPGIPLAIVRPDAQVVLIESTKKKAAFLRDTIAQIKGTRPFIWPGDHSDASEIKGRVPFISDLRAEQLARSSQRESFDVVTARAVGAMNWLAEWCLPLVKVGGTLLAMKGEKATEEIHQAIKIIKLLGGSDPIVHPVELPGTEHHVIVEIAKVKPTDPKYPRDPTTTHGKPLG